MQRNSILHAFEAYSIFMGSFLLISFILLTGACGNVKNNMQKQNSEFGNVVDKITATIANKQIFLVTPDTLKEKFYDIINFETEELTENVWVLSGYNSGSKLKWAVAEFLPNESKSDAKWDLLQIVLGCIPINGSFQSLYDAISNSISKNIGEPNKQYVKTTDKQISWSVGEYKEISLCDTTHINPHIDQMEHVILIRVSVLQGDPE